MTRKTLVAALAANLCLAAACSDSSPPDYPGGGNGNGNGQSSTGAELEKPGIRPVVGGRLHDATVAAFTGGTLDARALLNVARAELGPRVGKLDAGSFQVSSQQTTLRTDATRLEHVTMRQTVGGVPVDGTYLNMVLRPGNGGPGRLLSSSYKLYPNVQVDTAPTVDRAAAIASARRSLRLAARDAVSSPTLLIADVDGQLELTYQITSPKAHSRALVVASGPRAGRVAVLDGRIFETTGQVTGHLTVGGAPGATGTVEARTLPNLDITGDGASTQTDADGNYTLDVADGTSIEARLTGRAAITANQSGADPVASGTAGPALDLELSGPDAAEALLAQVTAYYFTDATRTYLEANGADSAAIGDPLTTNVNLPDICNAFYSPFERTINFFASGGGCNNSAIDTVVAHEYGHFVDDVFGGIQDGGLSEGWGDVLGCYLTGQSVLGAGLFDDGSAIRDCNNDYVYPPSGNDGVHNLGQAWAGFAWQARQGFIAQLGEEDGDALARQLVLPSLISNAADIPGAVREVFLRDDDDGDLSNQTPNWSVLYAAAEKHGLTFAIDPDETAPGAVADLSVLDAKATSVTLRWTAPGDDDQTGTATAYDLRFSFEEITEANFVDAQPITAPAPLPAGSLQTATVTALPETTLWYALVALDEAGNASALSNVVTATTTAGIDAYGEGAENGLGEWTATGLWHITERRFSEGAHSFWYGQEDTGNYDTGEANAGVLTSPIIDLSAVSQPVLILDQFIQVEAGDTFDLLTITVTDADDPSRVETYPKTISDTSGEFRGRALSLATFDGGRVQLAFAFDTVDNVANELEGWYLDNLRIVGNEPSLCLHDKCVEGEALEATCDPCVAQICAVDSFCCETAWDGLCVDQVQTVCGETCGGGPVCGDGLCEPGEDCETCPADCGQCPTQCEHDLCEPGAPLDPSCDPCAATVCAADDFCCGQYWDRVCVQEAEQLCGLQCQGCEHNLCDVGAPLDATCDPCAETVCAADPYCCDNAWDSRCVEEAASLCGLECESCSHSPCEAGAGLDPTCDPCVGAVCAADPYCCDNVWDARCIDQAADVCGLTCSAFR